MNIKKLSNWLLAVMVLLLPFRAMAELIIIEPGPDEQGNYFYDYGDVMVGDSASMVFELISDPIAPSDLRIDGLAIIDDTEGSFSFASSLPTFPVYLSPGDSIYVEVAFAPTVVLLQTATLNIRSNASNDPPGIEVMYALQGTGVTYEQPPSYLMEQLIAAYEAAVADSRLFGFGPGNSASGRLKAFGNMLDATDDLINEGNYGQACIQLTDVYNRADSDFPPPDFVYGPALGEIQAGINEVLIALACE